MSGIDLHGAAGDRCPVMVLDDFLVSGRPFPPHPHAGFSAVTYVFPDSKGGLRSRDSLGNDVQVGPGGIVWTEAGSGMLHHELPTQPGQPLHGLQFFVNARPANKLAPPRVLWLDGHEVPAWRNDAGDQVRIVVGEFGGVVSPMIPREPFSLLDLNLRTTLTLPLAADQVCVVYVLSGEISLGAGHDTMALTAADVVTLHGDDGPLTVQARKPAQALVFLGLEMPDPVVMHGPFIMNAPAQINDAILRYQKGEMGRLAPLPGDE
ncbi:pirin family protein [Nitrospirillum sp. BR 11752]|uniref:pirin family protein n=1 Tax=Nitrospirillum sp. BR 11752 TaxID=3104293 RepID=UPI002E9FB690|nr:pirin family protein [Nitrospirillum sp. BR 11752]